MSCELMRVMQNLSCRRKSEVHQRLSSLAHMPAEKRVVRKVLRPKPGHGFNELRHLNL